MKKNLRDFIIQGNYKKAEEICHNKDMIEKTKDISWMELAIEVRNSNNT